MLCCGAGESIFSDQLIPVPGMPTVARVPFFAKGKPTATTTDRDRCARFGKVEANPFQERDPAAKAKAHGFDRLEQVEGGRELGIFNYECLIFD